MFEILTNHIITTGPWALSMGSPQDVSLCKNGEFIHPENKNVYSLESKDFYSMSAVGRTNSEKKDLISTVSKSSSRNLLTMVEHLKVQTIK